MLKKTILAVALATVGTSAAMAADMPQGELSLGYVESGMDEGFKVGAAVDVLENLAVEVDYRDYGSDTSILEYGVAYDRAVSKDVSLVAGLAVFDLEAGAFEDDGYTVSLGAETQVADAVTLVAGVERLDLDSGEDTDFFMGVDVALAEDISLQLGHREVIGETSVSVAWRF